MNRGNPKPARRPFQLIRGGGRPEGGEAEQLDRFLIETDPILIASLQKEEHSLRRRKLGRSVAVFLVFAPALWLASLLSPTAARMASIASVASNVASNNDKAHLLIEQGKELVSKDRYNEALDDFTLATRLAPDLAEAWTALANCQLNNYQSELTEEAYQRALALEPGNQEALQGLGALYLRRGEQRKAEEVWLRGGLDRQLARLYLLQGRFGEAEARLAPSLARADGDELLYRMAQAARSRHLDAGLRSLLEPEPTGMSSWADFGWRLEKQERYGEAAAAFHQALAEVPADVNALSGMGGVLLALDRTQEARTYFERALRLDHDHVRSLNGLAGCLKSEGRVGEAIAVWQGMSRRYPGVNYGTPGLAWTYFELGDYGQAAVLLARLVRQHPYDSRVADALNVAVENIRPARSY